MAPFVGTDATTAVGSTAIQHLLIVVRVPELFDTRVVAVGLVIFKPSNFTFSAAREMVTVPLMVDHTVFGPTADVSDPRTVRSLAIDTFPVKDAFPASVTVAGEDDASIAS